MARLLPQAYPFGGSFHAATYVPLNSGYSRITQLLLFPLTFLGAQTFLWLSRVVTGWQLVRLGDRDRLPGCRQFHLQNILVFTATVAFSLGLVQIQLGRHGTRLNSLTGIASYLAEVTVCAMLANLLVTMPLFWTVFAARAKGAALLTPWAVISLLELACLIVSVLVAQSPDPSEFVFQLLILQVGALPVLFGSLIFLRSQGYTLLPAKGQSDPAKEVESMGKR